MIKVVDNISQMFYRHNKLKLNFCFAVWKITWKQLEWTNVDAVACKEVIRLYEVIQENITVQGLNNKKRERRELRNHYLKSIVKSCTMKVIEL